MSENPNRRMQLDAVMKAVQLRAWSCATTVRLAHITGNRETSFNTASGVLIEFGDRAVVATAWHVLEEYRDLRSRGRDVAIICDNMPFPEPTTAFRDPQRDIAFLDVPRTGRSALGAVPYRPGKCWPPNALHNGDSVLLCGFPKLFREHSDEIVHGDLNLLVDVRSVSEGHFMLQVEIGKLSQAGRVTIPENMTDFGGVSGAPVFLVDGGCNPLVGLVSESGATLPLWRVASLATVPVDIASHSSEAIWSS